MKKAFYIPESFVESDRDRLAAFLDRNPFGMLVSVDEGLPTVSHLPFLYERDAGQRGRLLAHLARANPHEALLCGERSVLVVFQGPHAYVSPSWYATPGGVPTWNYAVVHVHGRPRLIEDRTECAETLRRMTAVYESRFPAPWAFDTADEKRLRLLDMIVGLEIEITGVDGKFKLSQNRSPDDRARVIAGLDRCGTASATELSRMMADYYASKLA